MVKIRLKATIVLVTALACFNILAAPRNGTPDEILIDDLFYLSSEALKGRKTNTPDAINTQRYLVKRFEEAGLDQLTDFPGYKHSFVYNRGFDSQFYHTPQDTFDNINLAHFNNVANTAWALLLEMDKRM